MKKEIIVFVSNVLIVFFGVGIILNTVPLYKGTAAAAAEDILSASMPYTNLKASAQQVFPIFLIMPKRMQILITPRRKRRLRL